MTYFWTPLSSAAPSVLFVTLIFWMGHAPLIALFPALGVINMLATWEAAWLTGLSYESVVQSYNPIYVTDSVSAHGQGT